MSKSGSRFRARAMLSLAGLSAAILCFPAAGTRAAEQKAPPLASVDLVTESTGLVDIPAQISGRTVNLRVDTHDTMSSMTDSGAGQLRLPRHTLMNRHIVFYGWTRVNEFADADSVRIGPLNARAPNFYILPDNVVPQDVAGRLGADFLGNYDIEFDYPRGKLNLYSQGQCATIWPEGTAVRVPLDVSSRGVTVDVQLDGKATTASLNTGDATSVLNLSAAKEMFGVNEQTPGLKILASHNGLAWLLSFPFKSLAIQGVTIANPDVEIQTSVQLRPDLILGASILRRLHFCLSLDAQRLYLASQSGQ